MTVLVGVNCADGVVIGADSMATSAMGRSPLFQSQTDKLSIIGERIIVAGTGAVGLGQRFQNVVQKHWDDKKFQKPCWDCLRELTTAAVKDFQGTGVLTTVQSGYGYGALLAAPLEDKPHLVEFSVTDLQPELKSGKLNFVSMGSGQMLADPFMAFASRVLWGDSQPDVRIATFGVYWALAHTIKYAPGGVGHPIKLAMLRREKGHWKARTLDEIELQEQSMHIEQIETRISQYPKETIADAVAIAPPIPPK